VECADLAESVTSQQVEPHGSDLISPLTVQDEAQYATPSTHPLTSMINVSSGHSRWLGSILYKPLLVGSQTTSSHIPFSLDAWGYVARGFQQR
jgi:hypothetical protein